MGKRIILTDLSKRDAYSDIANTVIGLPATLDREWQRGDGYHSLWVTFDVPVLGYREHCFHAARYEER